MEYRGAGLPARGESYPGSVPRRTCARYLGEDRFAREHGFRTEVMSVDPAAWRGSLLDAWRWVQQRAAA